MRGWIIVVGCGIAATLLLPTPQAVAQENAASRAGRELGGILFRDRQREESAAIRGQIEGSIVAEHLAHAEQMRQEAHTLELTRQLQDALAQWMTRGGIAPEEANGIARAYRITPEQDAIVARAHREGSKATLAAIKAAYARYDYLLMDQLILGYVMAQEAESAQATPTPER